MSIDLFTLCVQIFNFLVLIFILNKILIKPLLKNLEERRKKIEQKIEDLDARDLEIQKEKEIYENKISEFENFKKEEKRKLETNLQEEKNLKISLLKEEIEKKEQEFNNSLESQKSIIVENISKNVCKNVGVLLKNIFLSINNIDLECAVLDKFFDEIKNLNIDELDKIKNNLSKNNIINVFTAISINDNYKILFEETFKNLDLDFKSLNFIYEENLVLGIKIEIGNYVINSNIQNIIDQFNKKLEQLF